MEWTEERVARLSELWTTGFSAAQIAEKLGGVTRNAVIGKVHRLGLSGRPSPIKKAPVAQKPIVVRKVLRPAPGIVKRPCQWPFGHPGESDFHFCGHESMVAKPYWEFVSFLNLKHYLLNLARPVLSLAKSIVTPISLYVFNVSDNYL